jgi:hypothetical protein
LPVPARFLTVILTAMLALASPARAQVDEFDDDFGPMTSAEQTALFEEGVAAYDVEDYARAFEIWLPLAQTGNMAAQRNVANMLRQGLGTPQDLPRAVYFYRRAADAGLVNAMINLGAMIRVGEGVDEPDPHEAARWFYRAARAGDPRAQYVLGVMVARGDGLEQDRDAALQLIRLAAAQGLRNANLRLAEAGLPLEPLADPSRPEFNLPPQLEPARGISLAPYLAPPAEARDAVTVAQVPEPELRLGANDTAASPEDGAEPVPNGTEDTSEGLARLLGGTR